MTGPVRILFFLSLFALPLSAAERPLRVFIEHSSPPFSALSAAGQPEGFAVELLKSVAADQNLALEFDLRPWQQIYSDFRQGQGDILGLVASSDERAALM